MSAQQAFSMDSLDVGMGITQKLTVATASTQSMPSYHALILEHRFLIMFVIQ